jgi:acyl carrier protein
MNVDATVVTVLGEVLKESVGDLRAQPVLAAHDWDSMASLEVLSQLQSRFDVLLDLRAFHDARTIEDLIELVTTAVTAKTADRH